MEIRSLKKFIRKRELEKNRNSSWIGTEIKKKRKEQELTLKEATNGKMSVSYLSKLENGKINVNNQYVSEILEKMEINKDLEKYYQLYQEYLIEFPKLVLEKNKNRINQIYKMTTDIDDFDFSLIKFIYYCYIKSPEDHERLIVKLIDVKETMTEIELKTFLVFLQKYYIFNDETFNALELVKLIDLLNIEDSYLKVVYYSNILELTYIMKRESFYIKFYEELERLAIKYNLYDFIKEEKERFILEMAKVGNLKFADEYFLKFNNSYPFNINYFYYLFYSKRYDDLLEIFEKNKFITEEEDFAVLNLKTLYLKKEYKGIEKELGKINFKKKLNLEDRLFIDFLFKRTMNDEYEYLKKDVLESGIKTLNPYIIAKCSKVLANNYFENNKYKAFCILVKENKKRIEIINNLYNKLII